MTLQCVICECDLDDEDAVDYPPDRAHSWCADAEYAYSEWRADDE